MMRLGLWQLVSLSGLSGAVDGVGVVARAEVLVEDGSVRAVERLHAPVRVAEVVRLE